MSLDALTQTQAQITADQANNLARNGSFEEWPASGPPSGWVLVGAGATVAKNTVNVRLGSASAAVTRAGANARLTYDATIQAGGLAFLRGKTYTVAVYARKPAGGRARVGLYDGVDQTLSGFACFADEWERILVTRTIELTATKLEVSLEVVDVDGTVQFDGVMLVEGLDAPGFQPNAADSQDPTVSDTTPPSIPTGLALSPGSNILNDGTFEAFIVATWTANPEGDVEGYRLRIKKTTDGANQWTVFTTDKATTLVFRGLQPNITYEVQVSAFDFAGNPSAFSAGVTTTTDANPGAPATPTGFTAVSFPLAVALTWNPNTERDLAYYELQRADDAAFSVNVSTRQIDGTAYVDKTQDTVSRFYRLRAIRRSRQADGTSLVASAYTVAIQAAGLLIGTAVIEALAVTESKVAALAISTAKLQDLAITTLKLAADAVTSAKIADLGIATADLADALITTVKIGGLQVTTATLADSSVTSVKIGDLEVNTADLASGSVTTVKIGALQITTATLADGAVTSLKIGDLEVATADIAGSAVTTAKIGALQVTTGVIADSAITTVKIGGLQITTGTIADSAVTSLKIGDLEIATVDIAGGAVTTAKVGNAQITNALIANLAVNTAQIADAAITTLKIADANIITAKIGDLQVTTLKIADGAITAAKITVTQLSAITADVGTLTAGLLRNAADTSRFDLTNERLRIRSSDAVSTRRFMIGDESPTGNYLYYDSATGKLVLAGDISARKLDFFGRAFVATYARADSVHIKLPLVSTPDLIISYHTGELTPRAAHFKIAAFPEGRALDGGLAGATDSLMNIWPNALYVGVDADVHELNEIFDLFCLSGLFATAGCRCRAKLVTYTGDGAVSRGISGVGFQPDVVIVFRADAPSVGEAPFWRTKSETADRCRRMSGDRVDAVGITSLDPDGFTVGNHSNVNASGGTYDALCIKDEFPPSAEVGVFKMLNYRGNGLDNRSIIGLGFQPDFVMIFFNAADVDAVGVGDPTWRTKSIALGDNSRRFSGGGNTPNLIQALETDGFQVGTDAQLNSNNRHYTALCFKNL